MKRMDRYEEQPPKRIVESRANKNQSLYENIGKNTRYTNISDVKNANAYDISNRVNQANTREEYRKMQEYSSIIQTPSVKKELEEFKNIYKNKENKVYDINSVLAEARKNRPANDSRDLKRKLKNDKYNILLSLNKEELEEYRKQRKERFMHPDEDDLHDIIDTIASRTIAGEIDKETGVDLLSELMATSIMDKVDTSEIKDIEIKETSHIDQSQELKQMSVSEEESNIEEKQEENTKESIVIDEKMDSEIASYVSDTKIDTNEEKTSKDTQVEEKYSKDIQVEEDGLVRASNAEDKTIPDINSSDMDNKDYQEEKKEEDQEEKAEQDELEKTNDALENEDFTLIKTEDIKLPDTYIKQELSKEEIMRLNAEMDAREKEEVKRQKDCDKTKKSKIKHVEIAKDDNEVDNMDDTFNETKLPFIVKLIFAIIIIGVLATVAYFIWQMK